MQIRNLLEKNTRITRLRHSSSWSALSSLCWGTAAFTMNIGKVEVDEGLGHPH